MSSDDELRDVSGVCANDGRKKRKVQSRACDHCRRMRIRCDTVNTQKVPCSHCVTSKAECTFLADAPKRYPPKGYIDDLEKRCEVLEALLKKNAPYINVEEIAGPKFNQENWFLLKETCVGPLVRCEPKSCPFISPLAAISPGSSTPLTDATNVSSALDDLESKMEKLSLAHLQERLHRNCSAPDFVETAYKLKFTSTGKTSEAEMHCAHFPPPVIEWEWMLFERPNPAKFHFPPGDLADQLVEAAFRYTLNMFPIVHRPTFDEDRKSKKYLKDFEFAQVYLMVCAIGARHSVDERVYVQNSGGGIEWTSAGWPYFSQVFNIRRPIIAPAELADLQARALMCLYLIGTSAPHAAWMMASATLHSAEDIWRAADDALQDPFGEQMWRRVFWSLVVIDRLSSCGLDRPVIAFDSEVAAELPLLMDDEDFDPRSKEWKRSPERPPHMAAFVQLIKLFEIVSRTGLLLRKLKAFPLTSDALSHVNCMAELNSALNAWLNSVPDHLKWNAHIKDNVFFDQAAHLHLLYYFVQINMHRSFIPALALHEASIKELALPSMTICVNAARCVGHILGPYSQRGYLGTPITHAVAFVSGLVLLISIWDVKKRNSASGLSSQPEDLKRIFDYLKRIEKTCLLAKILLDILTELASSHGIGEAPAGVGQKRRRDALSYLATRANKSLAAPQQLYSQSEITDTTRPKPPPSYTPITSDDLPHAQPSSFSTIDMQPETAVPPTSSACSLTSDTGIQGESDYFPARVISMASSTNINTFSDNIWSDLLGMGQLAGMDGVVLTATNDGDTPATAGHHGDWNWLNDVLSGVSPPPAPYPPDAP